VVAARLRCRRRSRTQGSRRAGPTLIKKMCAG
jgi:hypothetical protein